jgi:hypothetical protein
MTPPTFSIVIPTVDRPELLQKTIAACLLSPYPHLEVLVSDNFSTAETARTVEAFRSDPRVRYVRTGRRLSMPDHWEFAWQQATGDFIIINGDDDGFSPGLIGQLAEIASTFKAVLISWDAGLYYHPDWTLTGRNTFVFMSGHSRMLLDVDPQAMFASYARLSIPICFPQGTRICFSRELAARALIRTGRLFWPPYPDYSAPLLLLGLLKEERYIYWDALAGFGGRSCHSTAAAWEKENGKPGNPQRAKDFFDELSEQDLYGHSPLKMRSYSNGHVETLNLLREILPEAFSRHHVDQVALIAAVEREFRGIQIHNPFLGEREREAFRAYLGQQDPAVVAEAMREADSRERVHREAKWRRALPLSLRGRIAEWVNGTFLEDPLRKMFRLFFPPGIAAPPRTLGERGVRRHIMGRMTRIECADIDCRDGFDLIRALPDVAETFDPVDWTNVGSFFQSGFTRAAFALPKAQDAAR